MTFCIARWRSRCMDRARRQARTRTSPARNSSTRLFALTSRRLDGRRGRIRRPTRERLRRFAVCTRCCRSRASEGDGQRRIEMNFLPDVYVQCEVCGGKRYNHETLAVKYKGYSIADLLETPVADALPVLENIPQIKQKLQTLMDVGLGYIYLGQSAVTLSGGEAQRIKLSRELSKRQTGKTLYLLDEPTTGLHFDDVSKLLEVLHRLTDLGNSVIIIEHNMDVIRNADWIIDLGPEGGEKGGRVVAQGTPEQVARVKKSYTGQILAKVLLRASNIRTNGAQFSLTAEPGPGKG